MTNPLTHKNKDGKTLLHIAAEAGKRKNVIRLKNKGADVLAQDNKGRTPLHLASKNGQTKTMVAILGQVSITYEAISKIENPTRRRGNLIWNAEADAEESLKHLAESLEIHRQRADRLLERERQNQGSGSDYENRNEVEGLLRVCVSLEAGGELEKANLVRNFARANDKYNFLRTIATTSRGLVDVEKRLAVLERHFNFRAKDEDGNTALHLLASMQMLEKGTDDTVTLVEAMLEWDWSRTPNNLIKQLLEIELGAKNICRTLLVAISNQLYESWDIRYADCDEIPLILTPARTTMRDRGLRWIRERQDNTKITMSQLLQDVHVDWNTDEGQKALLRALSHSGLVTAQHLISSGIGKLRLGKVLIGYLENHSYYHARTVFEVIELFSQANAVMCATHDGKSLLYWVSESYASGPGRDAVLGALVAAGAEFDQNILDLWEKTGNINDLQKWGSPKRLVNTVHQINTNSNAAELHESGSNRENVRVN
jgi:hypothetical protein